MLCVSIVYAYKEMIYLHSLHNIRFHIENCGYRFVGEELTSAQGTYNWNSSPSQPFRDLSHNRIYYIKSGNAQIITHKGSIHLTEGNFYYFPANTILASRCETSMCHYFIHFTIPEGAHYFELLEYNPAICATDLLIALTEQLDMLFSKNSIDGDFKCDGALRFLLGSFFEDAKELDANIFKLTEVMKYIDEHLSESISVADLASIMHLSPVYFSALFKSILKITPIKYISEKRIIRAKQLLLNSNLSVKEISKQCGFAEPYYFSNWFYKNTNTYPLKYKQNGGC